MRFRGLAIISFAFFCAIVHSIALAQGKNELMIESYDKLLGDFAKETGMAEKNLSKAFDKQIELVRKIPRFKPAEKQIQIESFELKKIHLNNMGQSHSHQ